MVFAVASNLFSDNVKILKSEVSKTAYQGVVIALGSILIATGLVSWFTTGAISIEGVWSAQRNNVALWILDSIPFVFGIWGQYSSSIIAYQAGLIIMDKTEELRNKAANLEGQTVELRNKTANLEGRTEELRSKAASLEGQAEEWRSRVADLEKNATHDGITELPNRVLFYDRVEQAIAAANNQNQNQILSVLLVEIENLKDVDDTLGRTSTNNTLKKVAKRLLEINDSVAKIDGNVFAMLLTEVESSREPEQLAHYIQKAMEPAFLVDKLQLTVHSNVGIVHYPEHGEDVDTLVQRAGVALHIAQKSNKGYALYDPSFDVHSPYRLTLMSELRNAIDRNELDLFYQAKVDLQSGSLYGVEALVRWHHPVHGTISPDEFIPMAERTRMINQLTHWVLKRAFQDCAAWHAQGYNLKVSVNLSAKDLHDPELPDLISNIGRSVGIQPEWIMLEITEGSIMTEPENALAIIEVLHKMGYQFSIDDFGTGYSSLAYLKRMPLKELKIDKSFVMDILTSDNDVVIVKTIINLAHNLGLHVTAEGVENQTIMSFLKDNGCDVAQGYYINKPLSLLNFNQWITESKWKPMITETNQLS
jgi:diguanylate cyclase (GGDEF)-like protein